MTFTSLPLGFAPINSCGIPSCADFNQLPRTQHRAISMLKFLFHLRNPPTGCIDAGVLGRRIWRGPHLGLRHTRRRAHTRRVSSPHVFQSHYRAYPPSFYCPILGLFMCLVVGITWRGRIVQRRLLVWGGW